MDLDEFTRTGCVPDTNVDRSVWYSSEQLEGVSIRLKKRDLWRQFYELATEMIITKPGRRMYPYIEIEFEGLIPDQSYAIVLELRQSSESRFRFQGSKWVVSGRADPPRSGLDNMFVFTPRLGREWTHENCSMYLAKITNSLERVRHKYDELAAAVLTSMQKYLPVVHVVKSNSKANVASCSKASFLLPETEFIAVTAYQNAAVKDLKVANNPFAKAFRPGSRSERKRKSGPVKDPDRKRLNSDTSTASSGNSSPSCCTTSTVDVLINVVDDDSSPTPTTPSLPNCNFCTPKNESSPCPPYTETPTRLSGTMHQQMLVRPWEMSTWPLYNTRPFGFNIHYPMPIYWNSVYPHYPPMYPAVHPPATCSFESELIDLSKRTQEKCRIDATSGEHST